MARIPAVNLATKGWFTRLFLRVIFWMTRRKLGRVVMPVQINAHSATVLFGMGMFEEGLARSHQLPDDLKELAQLRAATLVGCPF